MVLYLISHLRYVVSISKLADQLVFLRIAYFALLDWRSTITWQALFADFLAHCVIALTHFVATLRKLCIPLRTEPRPHFCSVRGGEDWTQQSLHPFPVRLPLPKVAVREEGKMIKSQGHEGKLQ